MPRFSALKVFACVLLVAHGAYGKQSNRRNLPDRLKRGTSSHVRSDIETDASTTSSSPFVRRRVACHMYIWDAPSALLHKWCNHLMRDCVYEGRGGKKVGLVVDATVQSNRTLTLSLTCLPYHSCTRLLVHTHRTWIGPSVAVSLQPIQS